MSGRQRLSFAAIAAVIAIVAIVIAVSSGGGDDGSTTASATATPTAGATATATSTATTGGAEAKPKGTTIVIKDGRPAGGIQKIKVNQGDDIAFTVKSDTSDEIHVHGYDFHKDVKKGGTVSFDFPAKIDGTFVIELESRSEQIASLQVEP